MKSIKFLTVVAVFSILFASCTYNREYIKNYNEQTRILKNGFPDIYDLYKQGVIIIESVYLDLDTQKYHVLYRYR